MIVMIGLVLIVGVCTVVASKNLVLRPVGTIISLVPMLTMVIKIAKGGGLVTPLRAVSPCYALLS